MTCLIHLLNKEKVCGDVLLSCTKGTGHNKFARTGPSLSGVWGGGGGACFADTTYLMNITDKKCIGFEI